MATNASIRASLKDHKIIPEVVDDFTPSALLSIEYHPTHAHATLGNILTPADAQDLPILRITPDVPDEKATYTVVRSPPSYPTNSLTPHRY